MEDIVKALLQATSVQQETNRQAATAQQETNRQVAASIAAQQRLIDRQLPQLQYNRRQQAPDFAG